MLLHIFLSDKHPTTPLASVGAERCGLTHRKVVAVGDTSPMPRLGGELSQADAVRSWLAECGATIENSYRYVCHPKTREGL